MPPIDLSASLCFSFAEMEREATNMALISSKYLDDKYDDTQAVISTWLSKLRNFRRSQSGATFDWEIPTQRPIRTKLSIGQYEREGNGEHSVYATVSSVWQIAIPIVNARMPKRGTPQSHFQIIGKASTRVSMFAYQNYGPHQELARWRFEIGNLDSPGCHFHAQILGDDHDHVFPKSMPVPRLPNILFTPMDALEFVLAELFQEEWVKHVAQENDAIRNWAGCQRERLIKLLKWQQDRLEKHSGSPWTSLKAAKPDADLLVGAR